MQYCNFRSLRWFPVLLQYFQTPVSEWLGISCSTSTSKTSSPLFFAFLGFFSGVILDRSNRFFHLCPTTLELKLYPKSSVGSGFSFVGWPSLKCALHTREEFFGVQTFPFLISLLIFSIHPLLPSLSFFSVGKGESLNGGSQLQVFVPFKHVWTGLFRPFIQPFSAVWAANKNTIPVPKSHTQRRNQNRMITDLKYFASKHSSRN